MKRVFKLQQNWQILQRTPAGPLEAGEVSQLSGPEPSGDWIAVQRLDQVHPILLDAGRIADPRRPGNVQACLWVGEQDWVYRTRLDRPSPGPRYLLHLAGLDTLVDVYLNGRLLAEHRDCFLPLELDVTDDLADENVLLLHFHSPHAYLARRGWTEKLDGMIAPNRMIRKPHEDFNAFNGAKPYYTTVGPYDDIELISIPAGRIASLSCRANLDSRATCGRVEVEVLAEIRSAGQVELSLVDPGGQSAGRATLELTPGAEGLARARGGFSVDDPQLWQPRGFGRPDLYRVEARLSVGGESADESCKHVGFRTVRFDGDFALWVNGRRVRMWGTNLTPFEGVTHRHDSARMHAVLDLVEQAHCNTIRAWGPGAPWHEELFEEADRRGLLVWAELFHTWGPYSQDPDLLDLCRREARYYVSRLKHHPSILCWCGGNEVYMGSEQMFPDRPMPARRLFEEDYRQICRRLDPDRLYHPSSPAGGSFANAADGGDSHAYTHHWYVPGVRYAPLLTENARSLLPPLHSLERMLDVQDLWPEGHLARMLPAQSHERVWGQFLGQEKQSTDRTVYPPAWAQQFKDLATGHVGPVQEFWELGHCAEGMHYRVCAAAAKWLEACVGRLRRGREFWNPGPGRRCNGHFFWVFNSTWPKFGSHAVDYYLEPTSQFYALRRAYQPVLLSIEIEDHIRCWLVNDSADEIRGELIFQMRDADGAEVLHEMRRPVALGPDRSQIVADGDCFGMFWRENVIVAQLRDESGGLLAWAHTTARHEIQRQSPYPQARIQMRSVGPDTLELSSDTFARWVELTGEAEPDGDRFGWRFEDNFFDLLPGLAKRVKILGPPRQGTVRARSLFSPHDARVTLD
jgi:beta-galactosidase/beta-glucuronidase